MGMTIQVALDRAFDSTKTVLPVELARGVYITHPPSLSALKLMHLMIAAAGGRMADNVRHEIRLSDVRQINGLRNHDKASLTPLFAELASAVLTHDDPENKIITIGGFLDEAVIDYRNEGTGELIISWTFRSTFRRMAESSNHWAIIDRQTVFHLASKYSILLFQYVSSLEPYKHIKSKVFSISEIRNLLGVSDNKHRRFAELNRWAVKPAIAEINQHSRLLVTATPRRIGKSITHLEIAWRKKPERVQASSNPVSNRLASSIPFPKDGGITYLSYWEQIKKRAGCNRDDELIASEFRSFCHRQGISLEAASIAKIFSSYCSKVGRI